VAPARALAVISLLLLAVSACGGKEGGVESGVHGVGIIVQTDAPFAHEANLPDRLETVISAALTYWGGDWEQLAGRTITLSSGPYVACGSAPAATGCYDGELRVSAWDPGVGTVNCVEQTVLVHEIGHAIIGDSMHQDPRWMDFASVATALAGGVGYDSEGRVIPCVISTSTWRHPLDSP
jgi:hypothetical protein